MKGREGAGEDEREERDSERQMKREDGGKGERRRTREEGRGEEMGGGEEERKVGRCWTLRSVVRGVNA